jgi:hypothetical protein
VTIRWSLVAALAKRWLLPVWFVLLSAGTLFLLGLDAIGVDARIYYRGSEAWLQGHDPWEAFASYTVSYGTNYYHYAGLPSTVVLLAPGALLPEGLFVGLWLALTVASAVFIVRRCGLPAWWLLFPPLAEGIWSGNPGIVLLAMLLSGKTVLEGLAPVLKIYAAGPLALLPRARSFALGLGFGLATVIIAPGLWWSYIQELPRVSARLLSESAGGYGASQSPILFVVTLVAVAVLFFIDRRAAAFLAVPALWPVSEFHYSIFAMPFATPLLGALLAIPIRGLPAVAICLYVAVRVVRRRAAARGPAEEREAGGRSGFLAWLDERLATRDALADESAGGRDDRAPAPSGVQP